jgi:hypothetical protein
MNTIAIAATVTGARHLRMARNGQDGAAIWTAGDTAVAVVCDGCSAGSNSEVGARLGATLFARTLGARLVAGDAVSAPATWDRVRAEVTGVLAALLERVPGDRAAAVREYFLFTVVAAAATSDGAAVWAIGDGAYCFGEATCSLGPFADNEPPYLAYDLLGDPAPAHFELAPPGTGTIVIATDGALELEHGISPFASERYHEHPDRLRRTLSVLARGTDRIDWDERRVVRTPAVLQDDCAIGIVRRRPS